MAITLTYQPHKGVSIGDTLLLWGTDRESVRNLLNDTFEISDCVVELDAPVQSIIQRRDIYNMHQGHDNSFFLDFDENDQLTEVEAHYGFTIDVDGHFIDFSMDIEEAANLLGGISGNIKLLSEGEYYFKDLKLIIASGSAMGSSGNELSYFYCSKNVSHL
jgi:hypothetical protein